MRIRENQTNFIDLIKAFWTPDEIEIPFEQEIEYYSSELSETDKKMLKEASAHIKQLEKELYNHKIQKTKRKSDKAKIDKNELTSNKSRKYEEMNILENKEEKEHGERE